MRKTKSGTPTLGVLGGGQLAKMTAQAAYRLGFRVAVVEKKPDSPAGIMTKLEFVGSFEDDDALAKLADVSDVVTLENEFIDADRLRFVESKGPEVVPSPATIERIQDKLVQKRTLRKAGVPVADFVEVSDNADYRAIAEKIGEKFLLKSRTMGYDGYGNALVGNEREFAKGIEKLAGRGVGLMAESFVDFAMEPAVMIARTRKETVVYPIVETVQKNHICHIVKAPAEISAAKRKRVAEIALAAVEAVKGYGIFGVETFLTKSGEALVNEMAPRPHNSGHYSIEACRTSQFENHARAALGLPLGSPELVAPAAVMINLLGKREGAGTPDDYAVALSDPKAALHVYGKDASRIGRKMGHVTLLGETVNGALRKARAIEKQIRL